MNLLRSRLPRSACTLLLGGCCLLSACASGPSPEVQSMQAQLSDLQNQILQLQRQVATQDDIAALQRQLSDENDTDLRNKADGQLRLDSLQRSIEQLEAQVQDGNQQMSRLAEQLNNANRELQRIAANLGTASLPTVPPASPPVRSRPDPAPSSLSLEDQYANAYNAYLRGDFPSAIERFEDYIRRHPDTDLADNAHYWLGECHYREGRYRQAVQQFDELLSRYQRSDKTASALLKKGYAYLALNDRSQGVLQLQKVVRDFQGSDEADLARQRLAELGVDPTA